MKRLLLLAVPLLCFLSSCRKEVLVVSIDESQWLYRERGVVAYSDYSCGWFVVETPNGYSVLRSMNGMIPLQGDVLYGGLSSWGINSFYDRTEGYIISADVKQYWLGYYDALDEINYQCGR